MINMVHLNSGAHVNSSAVPTAEAIPGGESSAEGSIPFGALMFGLMNGEADSIAASGLMLPVLVTGAAPTELAGAETENEMPTAELLEQLIAWVESLSPELKEQLASNEQIKSWMAQANAELTMAVGVNGALISEAVQETEQTEAKPQSLAETLQRLLSALQGNPDQLYLVQVAQQAKPVIAQALSVMAADSPAVAAAVAQSMDKAVRSTEDGIARGSALLRDIGLLMDKMNGVVVSDKSPKSGSAADAAATHAAKMQHLTTLEAKSSFVRVLSLDGSVPSNASEAGKNVMETKIPAMETAPLTSTMSESIKPSSTEGSVKTDAAPQRVPISNLAEQLNQWIVKQAGTGKDNMMTQTVIKLLPEHLGQVEVKLSMHNGQLSATITTESAMAKDVLESNLAVLRTNLQSQGVTVEKLLVSQQPDFQSGMFNDGRKHQSSGRESDRGHQGQQDNSGEDWLDVLAINAQEQDDPFAGAYGGSFYAKA